MKRYRVIAINEDGKNKLYVKDLPNDKDVYFPDIPDGDIKGGPFQKVKAKLD